MYESTRKKHELLRQHCYELNVVWECEWDLEVKTNPDLTPFLQTLKLVDPLDPPPPRDAFFGGRTNVLHHEIDQANGEKIKYIDVTSLYLWVNKTQEYPVGHPHVLVNPSTSEWPL